MSNRRIYCVLLLVLFTGASLAGLRAFAADEPKKDERPANAVVLFDGTDLSKWQQKDGSPAKWKIIDGAMVAGGGDIVTKESFPNDFVLHVEFAPNDVGPGPTGQARGNSGVYLQGSYEIQVLDSFGVEKVTPGDCASIYSKKPADKNVSKPPGQWQTYDIQFRAPKYDAEGKKTKNPRVTVDWNGTRVHEDVEIDGVTVGGAAEKPGAGPILLQDHGNPVRYRNIWIAPLEEKK
jgi:hypothetical protein